MNFMNFLCQNCQTPFQILSEDEKYYAKIAVPPPTLCPPCRSQRRLSHENQIHLFQKTCSETGNHIISNYPPESPIPIYSQEYWYSDAFDGMKYGQDFNFSRHFFEQFKKLSDIVPRPTLFTDFLRDENSAYTNSSGKNKNCYLIFDSDENWDCYYSYGMSSSKSSMDCFRVQKLELCYENTDTNNCYNTLFATNAENCVDSAFIKNCIGVKNCLFCSNLHRKEYHLWNKPVSKETFQQTKKSLGSFENLKKTAEEFRVFAQKFPQRSMRGVKNENVIGNYLVNCKNAYQCFDSVDIWDGRYLNQVFMGAKDCMDADECGQCELVYESVNSGYNMYHVLFSHHCLNEISNLTYCIYCFHCQNCFGCVGLKGKKFCIFNKQYSETEYQTLVTKIIEHMKQTREWGEFFPANLSVFPYNLTRAQEDFPLTKEKALKKGYTWHEGEEKTYKPQTYQIPDHIADVPDTIANELLACEERVSDSVCGRNFKITPQELRLYRFLGVPIPRKCFFCRHKNRFQSRNPRRIYERTCDKCSTPISTTFSPEKPEAVYCERCFQESLE